MQFSSCLLDSLPFATFSKTHCRHDGSGTGIFPGLASQLRLSSAPFQHPQVKKRKADADKKVRQASKAGGDDGGAGLGGGVGGPAPGQQRNPKAFVYSGRGKAKKQAARTAERDQRRMHGRHQSYGQFCPFLVHLVQAGLNRTAPSLGKRP